MNLLSINEMIQAVLADTSATITPSYQWAGREVTQEVMVAEIIYHLEATYNQDFQGLEDVVSMYI